MKFVCIRSVRTRHRLSWFRANLVWVSLALSALFHVALAEEITTTSSPPPNSHFWDSVRLTKELQDRYVNVQGPITLVPSELPPQVLAGAPLLVSPGTPAPKGPLTFLGRFLTHIGLTPHAIFNQLYMTNPDIGPRPGRFSLGTGIVLGLDANLQKIMGIKGGEIHFEEILSRPTVNGGYPTGPAWAGAVGS